MTLPTTSRALKWLAAIADWLRTALMVIGVITVHDYASHRWPDGTLVAGVCLLSCTAVVFLWFTVILPFRAGFREGKPAARV